MPMFGKVKAYILDEVHMNTPAYFNALLKTLEDTPKHVYFFLCTTDPQKVLGTVKSRCSQYEVNPLTQKETVKLLEWVITEEDVEFSKEELQKIAEVSDGIPREALIILDQVIGDALRPRYLVIIALFVFLELVHPCDRISGEHIVAVNEYWNG